MSQVGTRKLYENDRVAVWEFVMEPGETTPVHTHVHDYVLHVLEGAPAEIFDKDMKFLFSGELKSGETAYFRIEGDELVADFGRLPATHAARNCGHTRHREILVEIK